MNYGVPGYDFGEREVVTADKLRRWIEGATWEGVSASDLGFALGAGLMLSGPSAATGITLGTLWFNPAAREVFVQTRRGWTALLLSTGLETNRFRIFANTQSFGPQGMGAYNSPTGCVTLGTAKVSLGGGMDKGQQIYASDLPSGLTQTTSDFPRARLSGLVPVTHFNLIGLSPERRGWVLQLTGGFLTAWGTDTTMGGAINKYIAGRACGVSLPEVGYRWLGPFYFLGFPLMLFRGPLP